MSYLRERSGSGLLTGLLCLAMAAAIALSVGLVLRARQAGTNVAALQTEVDALITETKRVAAEKEALEAELKTVNEALREARLSLSEYKTKADTMTGQLTALDGELEALRTDMDETGARVSALTEAEAPLWKLLDQGAGADPAELRTAIDALSALTGEAGDE